MVRRCRRRDIREITDASPARRHVARLRRQRRLRCRESRNGNAEWRARDVVQADRFAERDRRRVTPVLAADADLDRWPRGTGALDRDLDELADTFDVDRLEGIVIEQPVPEVEGEEPSLRVVA